MSRSCVLAVACALVIGSTARAESPTTGPADRAWAVTDAILARHVDPPTRQQMILAGMDAVSRAKLAANPPRVARRVSDLANPEQLAALLAESWAGSKVADRAKLEDAFFDGLLAVVPGGATLLSAKERKVAEQVEGNVYVGIQVALGLDEKANRPVFGTILEGGPAEAAGAKAGDLIEEVDGVSTLAMPLRDVVDRLRGEAGTVVNVRFRRPSTGEVFDRPMTRGRLPRATIHGIGPETAKSREVMLDRPLGIGYLKLTELTGSTPQELRAFAERLDAEGARALVLDLRELTHVGFHPSVLLADALLDGGTIGRVWSPDGERTYRAEPDALFRGWPIAVIVEGTVAPEVSWLCDALVDNHRATIVGGPVLGGDPLVSELVPIPGGEWSVRMATGRLQRSDGRPLTAVVRKDSDPGSMVDAQGNRLKIPATQYSIVPSAPGVSAFSFPYPLAPMQAPVDPLAKAREVLGAALKTASK